MEKTVNLVELFSGIGSQAKALKNLGADIYSNVIIPLTEEKN